MEWNLNTGAELPATELVALPQVHRVRVHNPTGGARIVDCGVEAVGGLEAGRSLAQVCTAGLAEILFTPADEQFVSGMLVTVATDQPVAACMASQYAGWQIQHGDYFAMGSGPMRAVGSPEKLFDEIGCRERPEHVFGVLESDKLPPQEVCEMIAEACRIKPDQLTLLAAPTSSLAGSIQVVARSVETALHKLHELGFDLKRIVSGFGSAPLPPVAADDLTGIGRTNDAILYGGRASLWVRGDDESLERVGPRIPSSASTDHGRTFLELFQQYGHDFYKMDPLLFSPAEVTLISLDSGRMLRYGELRTDILRQSFGA